MIVAKGVRGKKVVHVVNVLVEFVIESEVEAALGQEVRGATEQAARHRER